MRKRRIRNTNKPGQNLDSFLDILTNTVGVLMFIGLFVSLLAVEAGTIIRTPLSTDTKKIATFFEIRNNQVFLISDPKLDAEVDLILNNLPRCEVPDVPNNIPSYLYSFYLREIEQYQSCIKDRNREIQTFYASNDNYNISFTEDGSLKYELKPSSVGENSQQLKDTNSQFVNTLKQLNPNITYLAFIVRSDSFETFRSARETAWNLGYDVGWEPISDDRLLVFGSGGRSIGVQ